MSAAAKRRRRKATESSPLLGKETYAVLHNGNELAVRSARAIAITAAQERAMREFSEPTILTVERRSLFGPTVELSRIVRDEDGNILTYTVTPD